MIDSSYSSSRHAVIHVNPAVIFNRRMADEIDSKLEDTIGFVLAFLRDVGLDKAESVLLQEIGEKYPDLGAPASALSEEENDAEGEEPVAAPEPSREERCCSYYKENGVTFFLFMQTRCDKGPQLIKPCWCSNYNSGEKSNLDL